MSWFSKFDHFSAFHFTSRFSCVLLVLFGLLALFGCDKKVGLENEQIERIRAINPIAPVPLTGQLPLIGDPSQKDEFGYPTQYVDRAQLRSLLLHRQFAKLNGYFEHFQNSFEADSTYEYWPIDASEAFSSSEPHVYRLLSEWVQAFPNSFASYLARGSFLVDLGFALRGAQRSSQTSFNELRTMSAAHQAALKDLQKALELKPKSVAAYRQLIMISYASHTGSDSLILLDKALAVCPDCYQIRVTALFSKTPRWGGSYEVMEGILKTNSQSKNPRIKLLPGYINYDKARAYWSDERPTMAMEEIETACEFGENWEFLALRGQLHNSQEKYKLALADYDKVLELKPDNEDALAYRAGIRTKLGSPEAGANDLLRALRLNPTHRLAKRFFEYVVMNLDKTAAQYAEAGKTDDALRLLDLTLEMLPQHGPAQALREKLIRTAYSPTQQSITLLEQKIKANPNDLTSYRQLDYLIASLNKDYERIVALWTDFLNRNPESARGYVERGGAYHRLGKSRQAALDAKTACLKGSSEGCFLSQMMKINPFE